jgi:hypothetical protein
MDIPSHIIEQARDEIVEAVFKHGQFPKPARGKLRFAKLTLAGFCDQQEDCGELLSMILLDDIDGKSSVDGVIEKRLRAYLDDEGGDLLLDHAAILAEQELEESHE